MFVVLFLFTLDKIPLSYSNIFVYPSHPSPPPSPPTDSASAADDDDPSHPSPPPSDCTCLIFEV